MAALTWFWDLLYPRKCSLCEALGPVSPCDACLSQFVPHPDGLVSGHGPVAARLALYRYEGKAEEAVKALKYSRRTALAARMSALMRDAYDQIGYVPDAIVPVPIHWRRRCHRGFNQSELLCEAFPSELVQPNLLERWKATTPQVRLTREQRQKNLRGAFKGTQVVPDHVLLIDDVYTSGHTAEECARTLIQGGAKRVTVLTFCAGE